MDKQPHLYCSVVKSICFDPIWVYSNSAVILYYGLLVVANGAVWSSVALLNFHQYMRWTLNYINFWAVETVHFHQVWI